MSKTAYVLGFAFDPMKNVLLIEKSRPAWQRGLLNGVGGKIEDYDASPIAAMVREFHEETGLPTTIGQWRPIVAMEGDDWIVYVYTTELATVVTGLDKRQTDTDELVKVVNIKNIFDAPVISNLPWLIGLCRDAQMPVNHYTVTFL